MLVMGTRGSPLALAQARQFARELEAAHAGLTVGERVIRTTGDKNQTSSLPAIGGKGVFTLEIEAALLDGTIDFAVHSLKDLPPDLPEGLTLGCIPKRESADDVFVVNEKYNTSGFTEEQLASFAFLPHGARVGTSSLRRLAQLLYYRPDLIIEDIRGNIDTRLRKLHDEGLDAIVLAEAGLRRLGLAQSYNTVLINCFDCVPAPGQGALAIECRQNDNRVLELLNVLEDEATRIETSVERAVVRALSAGCSTPLGVLVEYYHAKDYGMTVWACVNSPDGKQRIEVVEVFQFSDGAEQTGEYIAQKLLDQGAAKLLNL